MTYSSLKQTAIQGNGNLAVSSKKKKINLKSF